MSWRVLVSAPYFLPVIDHYVDRMAQAGITVVRARVRERLEEADLLEQIRDIDGVICGDDRFTARVLESAPRLKVISKWGTGIDSIDRDVATRLGIRVCNTPNAFTEPVADSVFCYMLSFARTLQPTLAQMRSGGWEKLPGRALGEYTLGIIGVGNIGSAVAKRAAAFGMPMLGCDVQPIPASVTEATGLQQAPLEETLRRADFVTLHCDLNPSSQHLIDAAALAQMPSSAVLINTARGPIVDEQALTAALQEGRLAGAALDVFEHEPLPVDSPLRAMPNVLLAPHNANSSPRAWARVHESTLSQLMRGLEEVKR